MLGIKHKFVSLLFFSLISSSVIGILDGILTSALSNGPFLPVFATACALSLTVSVLVWIPGSLFLALTFENSGDLPGLPSEIKGMLHPENVGRRWSRTLFSVELIFFAIFFMTLIVLADIAIADSVATDVYASAGTAAIALLAGISIARLGTRLVKTHDSQFENLWRKWRDVKNDSRLSYAEQLISPWVVLLIFLMAVGLLLIWKIDTVVKIVVALPVRPILTVLAGWTTGLFVGIFRDYRKIGTAWKIGVFSGVPIAAIILSAITASGVFIDDRVRLAYKADNTVSGYAYELINGFLDSDGDSLLGILNDGDCAPHDFRISASTIEIPENGIDEDCDGRDLTWGDDSWPFQGVWDYPVPDKISKEKFNILLITLDAATPARMSLFGHDRPTTPNLEKIAGESALFKWAMAPGPSTRLAVPSIMTSKYGPQMDVLTGRRVPVEEFPSNRLMPEIFRRNGYRTYAVMSTLFFSNWKDILRGFDHVENLPVAYDSSNYHHHSGEYVTDFTLSLLHEASERPEQPFFMWVHYYDLHMPYTPVPGGKVYGKSDADIYDSELNYLDAQVGDLLAGLDTIFDRDNTIVIITADHGESFDKRHAGKPHGQDLFTSSIHVPLIIRAPFVKPFVFTGPVSTIDILPTLCNVLGIRGNYNFRGHSLVPQLIDGVDNMNRHVLSISYTPEDIDDIKPVNMAAVRTMTNSFIRDLETNTAEFYNLKDDPGETKNLIDSDAAAASEHRVLLARWLAWVERWNHEGIPDD